MSDRRTRRDAFLAYAFAQAFGWNWEQVQQIPEWLREFSYEFLLGDGPEGAL